METSRFRKCLRFSGISGNDCFDRAVLEMPESCSHSLEMTVLIGQFWKCLKGLVILWKWLKDGGPFFPFCLNVSQCGKYTLWLQHTPRQRDCNNQVSVSLLYKLAILTLNITVKCSDRIVVFLWSSLTLLQGHGFGTTVYRGSIQGVRETPEVFTTKREVLFYILSMRWKERNREQNRKQDDSTNCCDGSSLL